MATLLTDKGRKYKRIRPSSDEKNKLAENNLQWVLSSNVSAVGSVGDDLIIRFHNGSLYKYPGNGNLLNAMLKSASKGHFVWIKLRRPNARYQRIGSLPLLSDIQLNDEDLFKELETQGIRIQEPEVLTKPSVISSANIFKNLLAITIIDDIGMNLIPVDIIKNIRQTRV